MNRFCEVASLCVFTVIERKSSKECSIGEQNGMLCNLLSSHCKTYTHPNQLYLKNSTWGICIRSSTFYTGTLVIKFKHKFEVLICLILLFRMACVDAFRFSVGLNRISSPAQIILEKNRLHLNKTVSRYNCPFASVKVCLACSVVGTRVPLCFSIQAEISI